MPEILQVAERIMGKIKELETERPNLLAYSQSKAQAISDYDRSVALAIIKMKNGITLYLDGEVIQNTTATERPLIAKGICWAECLKKEQEEGGYKAVLSNIEAVKAELNGLQSINRNLSEV